MIRADLPVRATSARQRAKRDASAVRSPPSIEYRLSLSEPGSSTPSCHLALLSSKTTKTVACSPLAGVSIRSSFDILILEVGWWVELPILPPDHPPPHRIYACFVPRALRGACAVRRTSGTSGRKFEP